MPARDAHLCRIERAGEILEGVIDLAFEESGVWTVVDFKTDADIERDLDRYRRQVSLLCRGHRPRHRRQGGGRPFAPVILARWRSNRGCRPGPRDVGASSPCLSSPRISESARPRGDRDPRGERRGRVFERPATSPESPPPRRAAAPAPLSFRSRKSLQRRRGRRRSRRDTGVTAESDGGTGGDAGSSAPAGPPACPETMVLVDGEYCTDVETKCLKSRYAKQNKKTICEEFEEPSKCIGKEGAPALLHRLATSTPTRRASGPSVMNDFPHAQHLCAAAGQARLHRDRVDDGVRGPVVQALPVRLHARSRQMPRRSRLPVPQCPQDGVQGQGRAAHASSSASGTASVSGSQPECVSDYGVWDMPGNADELAADRDPRTDEQVRQRHHRRPVARRRAQPVPPKIYTHNEGFAYYYLSFRCCAEPDGKPTDPRTPKQIKRREKWR